MKIKIWILLGIDILLFCLTAGAACRYFQQEPGQEAMSMEVDLANKDTKKVALTFDDGPHPVYTPKLLEGLKERNVRATFFVMGQNAEKSRSIVKQAREEGHLIGNHTYSHVQLNKLSPEAQSEEIGRANELIYEITGQYPEYIRPPFGEWDKKMEGGVVMIPVLWSVDTLDWTTSDVPFIVRKGTTDIRDGDIILMHDYYSTSVTAAFKIIDELQKQGFEFVTVDELILE